MASKNILLVLADPEHRAACAARYRSAGYEVFSAGDLAHARPLTIGRYDLVLADTDLPDGDGLELLARVVDAPIWFYASDADALRLEAAGAAGQLNTDQTPPELDPVVGAPTVELIDWVEPEPIDESDLLGISGTGAAVTTLRHRIRRLAPSDDRVLVVGETGSGKERVLAALHRLSGRAGGPLVVVTAGAMPGELIDSELFGHVKGAFTDAHDDRPGRFVQADGGTLVIDEIADLPFAQQARLLRVLESGEVTPLGGATRSVDVRVLCATHKDLDQMVAEGHFRADLYHRIAVHILPVPPLRERLDDVPTLIAEMAPDLPLSDAVLDTLTAEPWPGNLRQLANFLARIGLLWNPETPLLPLVESELAQRAKGAAPGNWIRMPLAEVIGHRVAAVLPEDQELPEGLYAEVRREMERGLFGLVLERVGGNQVQAARVLGINRNTLHKRLKELGMIVAKRG
jgi:two-component system, NtrC family, nitrogen regulation response regulator GlnG